MKLSTKYLWTNKTGSALSGFAANHQELWKNEYGSDENVSLEEVIAYWSVRLDFSATAFEVDEPAVFNPALF